MINKKKIGIAIPCYNEEGNIDILYNRIIMIMSRYQYDFEIVFIDNKSTDNSRKILTKLATNDKRVKLIFNTKNFGPGNSGMHGFLNTEGDAVISLACDLQDPPELIPQFIQKWENGAKVVWGRKITSDENKFMFLLRKVYYNIVGRFSRYKTVDNITGFGLYDSDAMILFKKYRDPYPMLRFQVLEFGLDIAYVEYNQPERYSGKSSYNFKSYFKVAINSMFSTSDSLFSIFVYISIFIFIFFLLTVASLFIFSLNMDFILFMLCCTLVVSLICILIGIAMLGSYLVFINERIKNKPYVVEEKRINF